MAQGNDIWCLDNAVDTATITATGSASILLGPERLADPRTGKAWRPAAPGDVLTIRFAAPTPLDVIALFGIPPGAGFVLAAGSGIGASDVIAPVVWTPQIDPRIGQAIRVSEDASPAPVPAATELRLTNTNGVDIGRVWAGPAHWQPSVGHVTGAAQGIEDLSSIQRARRSAAVFAQSAARLRRMEVPYDMITPAEWDGPVWDLAMTAGTAKQLLFIPRRDAYPPERHAILGYQEAINPIEAAGWERFTRTFIIKEGG